MDFYAQQDTARRKTGQLIVLFCLSFVLIIGAVNVILYPFIYINRAKLSYSSAIYLENKRRQLEIKSHTSPAEQRKYLDYERRLRESHGSPEKQRNLMLSEMFPGDMMVVFIHLGFSLLVFAAIMVASFWRIKKLASSGGDWLAGQLGGVFVDPVDGGSADLHLRQLINVVDEMAIAASIPRPSIYVLEQEPGINALVAGWDYENAVIIVSRGALAALSRDELQGVVGHEMSHILSGDMRLNIRLVGLLYGILILAIAGKKLSSAKMLFGRKAGVGDYLFGKALLAIGSLGVFCGRLIRAGVSRQREFLADAHAVQLTRNPYGIAGALKKIGGFTKGSEMDMARREEVSHMFFASGQKFWTRLLATHPPLAERIRAIEDSFSADDFPEAKQRATAAAFQDSGMVYLQETNFEQNAAAGVSAAAPHEAGQTSQAANPLYSSFLQDTAGCETAALAALLRTCGKIRKRRARIESDDTATAIDITGEAIYSQMRLLVPKIKMLPPEQILPLAAMTLSKLDILPKRERAKIIDMLDRLAVMDGELTLSEYCLTRLARLHLSEEKKTVDDAAQPQPSAARLRQALVALFTVMAWCGGKDEKAAARAFEAGMKMLLPKTAPVYAPVANWVAALDDVLGLLLALPENVRKQIIAALVATIGDDGNICLEEAELLRLVCANLKLPMPSFTVRLGSPPQTAA